MSPERTAREIQEQSVRGAISILEWLISDLRSGALVVEDADLLSDVVPLPPLPDETWQMSAATGMISYRIKVRSRAAQKQYAAQLLERA